MYPDIRHLQFTQNTPQMLSCARTACGTIADDTGGFVIPFVAGGVERVLECSCYTVVIFLGDKYKSV
ncbi:hypothetical protein D3C74_481610 [compost metagenome]